MLTWVKRNWQLLLVIFIGLAILPVYMWFPAATDSAPLKFNSPDEMMNYFWAQELSQSALPLVTSASNERASFFKYTEPLEASANSLIRPRSVNVVADKIVPGSFYGLYFIYGKLGQIFGSNSIVYLTPFFAVLGIVFFYLLIALVFGRNVALISALLAYVFPGWIYFANRSMFHNVLFVSLLIVGLYLLVKVLFNQTDNPPDRRAGRKQTTGQSFITRQSPVVSYLLYSLAGFFIGLALITRLSELAWVVLLVLIILLLNFRKINWLGFLLLIAILILTFIPVLVVNYNLYGAPLSIGYRPDLEGEFQELITQPGLFYELLVSPFGFNLRTIASHVYHFLVRFFWYFSVPAGLGLLLWLLKFIFRARLPVRQVSQRSSRRKSAAEPNAPQTNVDTTPSGADISKQNFYKRQWAYLIILFLVTCFLLLYYGSWQFTDRIAQTTVAIGNSFIRYWLPIYLGMLPFIGLLVYWFISLFKKTWPRIVIAGLLIGLISMPSFLSVFWSSDESLMSLRDNIYIQQITSQKLTALVSPESIVLLGFKQADKIFYPEHRRIIPELAVPRDYEALRTLANHSELYYYHFAPTTTVEYLSRRDFEPYGLAIEIDSGQKVYGDEWIYKIVPTSAVPNSHE
jgi:hypothetical protein